MVRFQGIAPPCKLAPRVVSAEDYCFRTAAARMGAPDRLFQNRLDHHIIRARVEYQLKPLWHDLVRALVSGPGSPSDRCEMRSKASHLLLRSGTGGMISPRSQTWSRGVGNSLPCLSRY